MDIIDNYNSKIRELYQSKLISKSPDELDNNDLAKIFEYYTCIQLTKEFNEEFLTYEDISPDFKEENQMSQADTGIDCCNMKDKIVQCKLRKNNLTLKECATFFASQNSIDPETGDTIIRWKKLILARNSDCKLSTHLQSKSKMFIDKSYDLEDLIQYCNQLFENPPTTPIQPEDT